ncbi:MAG TPA: hypothetical protein VNN13_05405 [Methylomirabilota bacterium]|nr:hypothetical protein [Methylomirabilota bacterium]
MVSIGKAIIWEACLPSSLENFALPVPSRRGSSWKKIGGARFDGRARLLCAESEEL